MRQFISGALLLVFVLVPLTVNAQSGADIKTGATAKEVYSILGKPMGRVVRGTKVTWMYAKGSVVFENSKVVETTFKASMAEKARNQAILEAEKQKAAAKSDAGAQKMRQATLPVKTVAVPARGPGMKISADHKNARAEASAKLTTVKATRAEALRLAKEALVVAERQAKEEVSIDPDASAKKHALALRAYEAEVKRIDVKYQADLAEISRKMKEADARYARHMAAQQQSSKTAARPVVRKKTRLPVLKSGKKDCPVCGMTVAPAGKVLTPSGKQLKVYECPVGHKCAGE